MRRLRILLAALIAAMATIAAPIAANAAATGVATDVTTNVATRVVPPGATRHAGKISATASVTIYSVVVCHPALSGSAFPLTATTSYPPSGCSNSFNWGYTVSGSGTGQATWDSPFYYGWTCTAYAWIPDSHSNDPNAQYYFRDNGTYLGNDAFVNQQNVTNNWVNVTNNSWWYVNDHMRVTLSDQNPMGQAGWYIGAYAMEFDCY